jgi:hypothetical protein
VSSNPLAVALLSICDLPSLRESTLALRPEVAQHFAARISLKDIK